jgi:hypothetical protein
MGEAMTQSTLPTHQWLRANVDLTNFVGIALLSACLVGLPSFDARAQSIPSQPVAIVEEVSTANVGVDIFEYLEAGRQIRLSASDKLVLGYLSSCLRETIHGGDVTVGTVQSTVNGGLVIREEVECDGGAADLSVAEASQSGVIAFRQGPSSHTRGTRSHPIKIFSSEPVFLFSQEASELVIHRLDRDEDELDLPIRQAWLDLADQNLSDSLGPPHTLVAGGLYEARVGTAKLVFEIASDAIAGGPLVGRMIQF